MAAPAKPLMLKDFLKLDPSGDSSSNSGFQCYPRRCVAGGGSAAAAVILDGRRPTALARISAAIKQLRLLPSSAASLSSDSDHASSSTYSLSRTFSKRLKAGGRFWNRRGTSPRPPAAASVSSHSSNVLSLSTETLSSYAPSVVSCSNSYLPSSKGSSGWLADIADAAAGDEIMARVDGTQESQKLEEDKDEQQRSPVAVSDFPFEEDDDDDEAAASDHRKNSAAPHDRLAAVDPVDLDARFADHEQLCRSPHTREYELLLSDLLTERRLQRPDDGDGGRSGRRHRGRDERTDDELVAAVERWMDGDGWRWEVHGRRGEAELEEMERPGGWLGLEEEMTAVERTVAEAMMEEMLDELLVVLL